MRWAVLILALAPGAYAQLDVYGGLLSAPCAGGPKAHAYTEKSGNRWWMCTPAGNKIFYQNLSGATLDAMTSAEAAAVVAKYGGATSWSHAMVTFAKSIGFHGMGQLSDGSLYPWNNTVQGLAQQTANISTYVLGNVGAHAARPSKTFVWGMNGNYLGYSVAGCADFYDPQYNTYITDFYAHDPGMTAFLASPFTAIVFSDDTDNVCGMGGSPDLDTYPAARYKPHVGYMITTASPVQTFNPRPYSGGAAIYYSDNVVYTKQHLSNWLSTKYSGNISAMNAAWGSSYTTFGSTGTQVTNELVGTGNGSTKVFTFTLAHGMVSPFSVAVKVTGSQIAGDCPWTHDGGDGNAPCNIAGTTARPYNCSVDGNCNGNLMGDSSSPLDVGTSAPWSVPTQLSSVDAPGSGLPQATYYFQTVWVDASGNPVSPPSPMRALNFSTGEPRVSVSADNGASDRPARATGVNIYVGCQMITGTGIKNCANNAAGFPPPTLQAANVPYPSGSWTEALTGLVVGAALPGPLSHIDYHSGSATLTFLTAPASGAAITVSYVYGGWPFGTGFLDEDGRNTAWVGTNPICQLPRLGSTPGSQSYGCSSSVDSSHAIIDANPNYAADVDLWSKDWSQNYFHLNKVALNAAAPGMLFGGADTQGDWGAGARRRTLEGAANDVDVLFWLWPASQPSVASQTAALNYVTQYFGDKPMQNFLTIHAQPDSDLATYTFEGSTGTLATPTQPARAALYYDIINRELTTLSYNGTYQWIGMSWWSLYSFGHQKENINWGVMTIKGNAFNAHDGASGSVTCSAPLASFTCGGEVEGPMPYGDLFSGPTGVIAAHNLWKTFASGGGGGPVIKTVCPSGCDYTTSQLQLGINDVASTCGSTLVLATGTYTGNYTVPGSNCTLANPITVRAAATIPPAGVRITPNYLDPTPKIPVLQVASAGSVLRFAYGDTQAKGWLWKGIAFNCSLGAANQICIDVGTQDGAAFNASLANPVNATSANLPSSIEFNHCILRGSRLGLARVGLELNGQTLRVVDSWLGDLWDVGATDGQAIRSLSGDGPIDIINTYLDGQTETLGVGGTGSVVTTPPTVYGTFIGFLTGGSLPGNVMVDHSHLTHGLYLRYDGMNPFVRANNTLVRLGQVWLVYSDTTATSAGGAGTRLGVWQAQQAAVSGASFPVSFCSTNNCTFTDGGITWKALNNFSGGETYIGPGIAKNLAECKQCGAWTIRRSFLQHAWEGGGGGGAQGFGLTFSHRSNVAPYSVMGPITFRNNIIDDVAGLLQASAFGDDADSNVYPSVRSASVGPYNITAGNNVLVVDGTTVTLTTGSRTAAQIAEQINATLPRLTVTSVGSPVDNNPYWTKYTLTLSGNVQYGMAFDVPFILGAIRNGFNRTDVAQSLDNLSVTIDCTYDSTFNGGAGRPLDACGAVGPNQVRLMLPYGYRISASPSATIATPTVASAYSDGSTGGSYLLIVKAQYFKLLTISGSAAASLGLPTGNIYYCTHPVTRQWYACGVSKGVTFSNNLVTNASTDSNKFAAARSPFMIWPGNIHPLDISNNTVSYKYGPFLLGQGSIPNASATVRNNIVLFGSAALSGETSYFTDGSQSGLSWLHSYLCTPELTGSNIGSYQFMAPGTPLPTCQPGFASRNILPGATKDSGEILVGGTVPSSTTVPASSFNQGASRVAFLPGTWQLATPGSQVTLSGEFTILGNANTSTANTSGAGLELGIKFFADLDGQVSRIRVYRAGPCPTENVVATLWSPAGASLATATITNAPPGQWSEAVFSSPVPITASQTYTASAHGVSCYTTNLPSNNTPIDSAVLHTPANALVYAVGTGAYPTTPNGQGFGIDVTYTSTQSITVGSFGTIGSQDAKAWNDPSDVGVDNSKLPLLRNVSVTYSDRAAIVSWLDSEVSRDIPGVLRLCTTDPEYNPTCSPVGSITTADPVTGALSDNSDNDNSPKRGLERAIVVTGLSASTTYYAQLYRAGHYKAFSFTTMPNMSDTVTASVSREATAAMGSVANMLVTTATSYARSSGSLSGTMASGSASCTAPGICQYNFMAQTLGDPQWWRAQMRDASNAVLYSYPVVLTIPGGTTQSIP